MALFPKNKKQQDLPRRRQAAPANEARVTDTSLQQRYAFRRNRTLTGSASSRVVSTSESKAQLKSPRVQAHDLTQQRRHVGGILFIVLIGVAVLYGLVSQFTAGVVVKAHDVSLQLDSNYGAIIESYLASQPIERLRFMVNVDRLNDYVQVKAPEVASIAVDGSAGFGKSRFVVTMRQPIAGWSINGRQQYVDETGTSFERNYYPSPSVQIVDKSGVQVEAGQAVASNRFLSFVGLSVGLAKKRGYNVTQVIIPSGTTRQIELGCDGVGYPIKLSVDRPAGEQIEDMDRAVRWLASKGKKPEYLDIRVSGEAFYR